MEINHLIKDVTGAFETDTGKLVCVSSHKYREIEICFDGGSYIPFATIKLYSSDLFKDADKVFKDAVNLGMEIERRWNDIELQKEKHKGLEEKYQSLLTVAICLSDEFKTVKQILMNQGWDLKIGDRTLPKMDEIRSIQ